MNNCMKWCLWALVTLFSVLFLAPAGYSEACEDYDEVVAFLDGLVEDGKAASWSVFSGEYIPADHCGFAIDFIQPVDHNEPDGPTFIQTIVLDHGSRTSPTVFRTSGYYMWYDRREPSRILNANQLSAGHRYFGDIDASIHGYGYLNEYQAASDHNAIVLAIAPFYSGAFIVSGISKGGENVPFFQYYYPETHEEYIDGSIAYVAPVSRARADNRYRAYITEQLEVVDCTDKMADFQREVLRRKKSDAFLADMDNYGEFTVWPGGKESVIDSAVSEYSFYVLQYTGHCDNVPLPDAANSVLLESLEHHAGISWYADYNWRPWSSYFWQAWTHQGYGALHTQPLIDKLVYNPNNYAPYIAGIERMDPDVEFDASILMDIAGWVKKDARKIIFLYGSLDPYTAAAYDVGRRHKKRQVYKYILPGGTHGAQLCDLPEPQRMEAMKVLRRWTHVDPQCEPPSMVRQRSEEEAINIRKIRLP